jgi:hypothetical protein
MTKALVNISLAQHLGPGIDVVRAELGGSFGTEDSKLLKGWAESLNAEVNRLYKEHGHNICILIDISGLESYSDPQIINILAELMKSDKNFVYKTATYGGKRNHEMVQQIISGMAGRNNLRNFSQEKEALQWLKE